MSLDSDAVRAFVTRTMVTIKAPYAKVLRRSYDPLFAAQRDATGGNAYLVGTQAFLPAMVVMTFNDLRPGWVVQTLVPDLVPQHQAWYERYHRFVCDSKKIQQTLDSVLMRAKTRQDVRDMLPEPVLKLIGNDPLVEGLTRTRPDLYAGDPSPFAYDRDAYKAARTERLQHWDSQLLNLYERVGGTINMFVGYQLL